MKHTSSDFSIDRYRQLSFRDRESFLSQLWKEIFGFEIGFIVGVRVARYAEPPHDSKWSPLLAELLRTEDGGVLAPDIARSFARLQVSDGLPTLLFAMDSAHPKVRWWGVWGAGAIATSGAVPRLIELLNDSAVQDEAAAALWQIGDANGLGPLREAAARTSGHAGKMLAMRASQLARKLDRIRYDAA